MAGSKTSYRIFTSVKPKLVKLCLGTGVLESGELKAISILCPNLRELEIHNYDDSFSDKDFNEALCRMANLDKLYLKLGLTLFSRGYLTFDCDFLNYVPEKMLKKIKCLCINNYYYESEILDLNIKTFKENNPKVIFQVRPT